MNTDDVASFPGYMHYMKKYKGGRTDWESLIDIYCIQAASITVVLIFHHYTQSALFSAILHLSRVFGQITMCIHFPIYQLSQLINFCRIYKEVSGLHWEFSANTHTRSRLVSK